MSRRAARGRAAAAGALAMLVAPGAGTEAQDGFTPVPSLNLSGVSGLMDMPSGEAQPDGEFNLALSRFGNVTRTTLSFQILPRVSGSFRYIGTRDLNFSGFDDYFDRAFDLRLLLLREREERPWPSVTLGFQDFIGTGLYSGEYLVATKTLPRGVKVTGGLGWGRLGSLGDLGSPLGDRPPIDIGLGGTIDADVFFRGPVAPFAGIEWQATERLGFKAEYSSDAYELEDEEQGALDRRSPINLGAEYRIDDTVRLGAYYMYGSELGASVQFALNPRRPPNAGSIDGAPPPVLRRPPAAAGGHPTGWTGEAATVALGDALSEQLAEEGIELEAIAVGSDAVEVRVFNTRYDAASQAVGRTARVLSRVMPASVETFRIVPASNDMPLSAVTVRRSALEEAVIAADGTEALLAASPVAEAPPARLSPAEVLPDLYPRWGLSVRPYVRLSYFDPDEPVRYELGGRLTGSFEPAPGVVASGSVTKRAFSTLDDIERESNSVLPRVRTDLARYASEGDPSLERLTGAYYFKPASDLYGRVTAGYLERMFGGVSTELLWKPVASPLALGVEVNYARQRDFDQRLGFRDYDVVTGHASAYYEFENGFEAQVDAGRYLAGDWGATFSLGRSFANGWRAGAYFTVTDVTAEEFGEGSFDKGISFSIPVSWLTGQPTTRDVGTSISSLTRDGGARLSVEGRLYEQVEPYHERGLDWRGGRILR